VAEERIHRTWLHSDRTIPSRFVRPVVAFTHIEAAGGAVMLVAAVLALIWANAPFGETYEEFWETHIEIGVGSQVLELTLREIVNDGLMAIFFFVVGLEIKRELVLGDLRDPKRAALPVMAAVGGMIVPAILYLIIAGGEPGAARGWGVPMATDIAFSVGVISLLGRRVPVGAKLFLLTLAIADDIGAITVIAVFYTKGLLFGWLGVSLAGLAITWFANRAGIRSLAFYGVVALVIWFALLESGVHATLAGVTLGFLTPTRSWYSDEEYRDKASRLLDRFAFDAAAPRAVDRIDQDALDMAAVARESVPPLRRLENALHPWSSFVVVPIFALANAGVRFAGIDLLEALTHPVALGVAIGLFLGKLTGVTAFAWLAVRLGWGKLPKLTTWTHIVGLGALAGVGFTVAIFVAGLAFDDPTLNDRAKTGIFLGSFVAGVVGYTMLRMMKTTPAPDAKKVPASAESTARIVTGPAGD
jgi:NhaA family Na+:H+ antiporter